MITRDVTSVNSLYNVVTLAVEWEKKWHPEIAEPEVALPQHAEVLREYLASVG